MQNIAKLAMQSFAVLTPPLAIPPSHRPLRLLAKNSRHFCGGCLGRRPPRYFLFYAVKERKEKHAIGKLLPSLFKSANQQVWHDDRICAPEICVAPGCVVSKNLRLTFFLDIYT
ncbi:hypothetical protein TNCV_2519631 [Trichonephila clavipes]|nr:hypothetical protein TNCV_2519631 [Trichonephila clavipes]